MKDPACHLPATDAGKWDTARVSRIDWAGAARMAKARAAAGVELDDTDRESLRRDEGVLLDPSTDNLITTSTAPTAQEGRRVHRT